MFFLHFVYHILWCCVLCIYTFLSRFQLLIMNEMMIFCAYGRPMGHLFFLLFSYVIFLILCKLFLLYFILYGIHVHIHIFVHTMEACNKDYYYYYYNVYICDDHYTLETKHVYGNLNGFAHFWLFNDNLNPTSHFRYYKMITTVGLNLCRHFVTIRD